MLGSNAAPHFPVASGLNFRRTLELFSLEQKINGGFAFLKGLRQAIPMSAQQIIPVVPFMGMQFDQHRRAACREQSGGAAQNVSRHSFDIDLEEIAPVDDVVQRSYP